MAFLSSQHHSFDIALAATYSIEGAILIHHFQHWIGVNIRKGTNFYDGRTWSYQTIEEILSHFPYLSRNTVLRRIEYLVKEGVLLKGNYNKMAMDRTLWYAFADEEKFKVDVHYSNNPYENPKRKIDLPKTQNAFLTLGKAIPDTKPDTKTDKEKESVKEKSAAPPPPALILFGERVRMAQEQYDRLVEVFGKEDVELKVEELNGFYYTNPKRFNQYLDHFQVIINWFRKEGKRMQPTLSQKCESYATNVKKRHFFNDSNYKLIPGGVLNVEKQKDIYYKNQYDLELFKQELTRIFKE